MKVAYKSIGILTVYQERGGAMRKCVLLMLLLGAVVWGGCSRENSRGDAIGAKAQELVDLVEQNYRGWSNRLFMARFEGELLALPEKSDRIRCVRQYRGWRDSVGAKHVGGATNKVQEIEVDI